MFSDSFNSLRHTLALRLTILYAAVFAISSTLAFVLIYFFMVAVVEQRTDDDMQDDVEEFSEFLKVGGLDRVKREIELEITGEDPGSLYFRVWSGTGELLASTDLSGWPDLAEPDPLSLQPADDHGPAIETMDLTQLEHDVRRIYGVIGPGIVLEMGQSLEDDDEFIEVFMNGFLLTLAAVIFLGGPIGWFLARRALRGVREVTRTAIEITNGELGQRVVVRRQGTELDALASAFNTMLDRIQSLMVGMREMSDNLAHDLRSPLGRIRASAEMALLKVDSREDAEVLVATTAEECDRLLALINTTLDIAEAESGAAKYNLKNVNLVELVQDAVELFQPIAEDKQVTLDVNLPGQCRITVDRQRLQRVIANLIDNALKYISGGGRVVIGLIDDTERVQLSVRDDGMGISADDQSRVFDRFYRCERSRTENGNGLGLSLALAIVRAHGGNIYVESTLGEGAAFTTVLPRAAS